MIYMHSTHARFQKINQALVNVWREVPEVGVLRVENRADICLTFQGRGRGVRWGPTTGDEPHIAELHVCSES